MTRYCHGAANSLALMQLWPGGRACAANNRLAVRQRTDRSHRPAYHSNARLLFAAPLTRSPNKGNVHMSVAKIIEISSDSKIGFQDAIEAGLKRAESTLKNVKGAWIAEQKLTVENGHISSYRVIMRVSFVID